MAKTTDYTTAISSRASIYKPLQTWQTRILRLHPSANPDEPLVGDIWTAGLGHNQQLVLSMNLELITFEAISYAWGTWTENDLVSIICNGEPFKITPSLAGALRRFRYGDRHRYLWADALCIDQSNDDEKSFQAINMFDIFHKATTTLVWLGESSPDIDEFVAYKFDVPRKAAEYQYDDGCIRWPHPGLEDSTLVHGYVELTFFCGRHEIPFDEYRSLGVRLIESKAMFPERILLTSQLRTSLSALKDLLPADGIKLATLLERRQLRLRLKGQALVYFLARDKWLSMSDCEPVNGNIQGSMLDLIHVLSRGKNLEASDPRDFVYVLLGLTDCLVVHKSQGEAGHDEPDERSTCIVIDYTQTVAEVFESVALYIMRTAQSLYLLTVHRPITSWHISGSLSSWISTWGPDGSVQNRSMARICPPPQYRRPRPIVERNVPRSLYVSRSYRDRGTLILYGACLAQVVSCTRRQGHQVTAYLSHLVSRRDSSISKPLQWRGQGRELLSADERENFRLFSYPDASTPQAGDIMVVVEGLRGHVLYLRPTRHRYIFIAADQLSAYVVESLIRTEHVEETHMVRTSKNGKTTKVEQWEYHRILNTLYARLAGMLPLFFEAEERGGMREFVLC